MNSSNPATYTSTPVEMLGLDARATFITRTYNHLLAAIVGFVLVEVFFFTSGLAEVMARTMLGVNWLLILGGFVIVNWLATRAAQQSASMTWMPRLMRASCATITAWIRSHLAAPSRRPWSFTISVR